MSIISNANLSASSKRTYGYAYDRLMLLTDYVAISNMSEKRVLKLIKDAEVPANSKNVMLSVILLIRRHNEQTVDLLIKYKETKMSKQMDKEKEAKNEELVKTLPSYDTYMMYVNDLYRQKDWRSYIVNYLLITYGVRNLDLNVIITRDKFVASKRRESEVNYLYVTKRYVKFIRNHYKTHSSYGRKEDTITATKFMYAVNEYLDDNFEKPLLDVEEQSVGATIRNMTYNMIGEGGIYKILVEYHKSRGDVNKLKALSISRGHQLDTQMGYYDISNPN